jgi:hypothetical protein
MLTSCCSVNMRRRDTVDEICRVSCTIFEEKEGEKNVKEETNVLVSQSSYFVVKSLLLTHG